MQVLGRLELGGEIGCLDDDVYDRCEGVLSIAEPWIYQAVRLKVNKIGTSWHELGPQRREMTRF
jgi:hypothetical protein